MLPYLLPGSEFEQELNVEVIRLTMLTAVKDVESFPMNEVCGVSPFIGNGSAFVTEPALLQPRYHEWHESQQYRGLDLPQREAGRPDDLPQ